MDTTIVVYTANIGGYDWLWPAPKDIKCICFTNGPVDAPGWEVRQIKRVFGTPKADALRFKYLPHLYFPESSCTIWVDANIGFRSHPAELLDLAYESGMAVRPHPVRDCIYEEALAIVTALRAPEEIVQEQVRAMESAGYPAYNGLSETGILVRFNRPEVCRFNEAMWADICRWASWRDQLSFNYVGWQMGIKWGAILGGSLFDDDHPLFRWRWHGCASS